MEPNEKRSKSKSTRIFLQRTKLSSGGQSEVIGTSQGTSQLLPYFAEKSFSIGKNPIGANFQIFKAQIRGKSQPSPSAVSLHIKRKLLQELNKTDKRIVKRN